MKGGQAASSTDQLAGLGHSYAMRASVPLSKSHKTSEISDSRMMLTYKIHCFSHMMTDRAICRCCLCLYSLQLIHYGFRVYPKLIARFTVQRRRYLTDPLSAVDVDDGSSHQVAVRRSQENLEGAERSNDQVRSASSTSKDDGFPPIACMHRITLT